jgi:hypothetical protein
MRILFQLVLFIGLFVLSSCGGGGGGNSASSTSPSVDAATPTTITLAPAYLDPVGGVTNVVIPTAGSTDATGLVTGWIASTNSKIKFSVVDTSPAVSTITINNVNYVSGSSYSIAAAGNLTFVVTSTQTGSVTVSRTFTVSVAAANNAAVPSAVTLSLGNTNSVQTVTNVSIPLSGATDTTGAISGWISASNSNIKFAVTDTAPASSTITVNGGAYTSGSDYVIATASPLTVVISTTETGKMTSLRTFTITVGSATLTDPTLSTISDITIDSSDGLGLCFGSSSSDCPTAVNSWIYIPYPTSTSPGGFTGFSSINPNVFFAGSHTDANSLKNIFQFNFTFGANWQSIQTVITLYQAATPYFNASSTSFALTINPTNNGGGGNVCQNNGVAIQSVGGAMECICPIYYDGAGCYQFDGAQQDITINVGNPGSPSH